MENSKTEESDETLLRDEALDGPERKKKRNPDTTLRTDGEEDTLYNDGLDVKDDSPPFVGTPGNDSTR